MKIYFSFLIVFSVLHTTAQTPELLVQLGHSDRVKCLDYSKDGDYIISGGDDDVIKLWQVANGQMVRTFQGHRGQIYDVKWAAGGIFSCSWDDRRIIKWDILTGKILTEYKF